MEFSISIEKKVSIFFLPLYNINMGSRSYCFTINNYENDIKEKIALWKCRYVIGGYEIGESGTKHIQGYIEFKETHRISALKKIHDKAHWEKRRGTRDEARNYCMKDNDFFEFGSWENGGQGKRNDLNDLVTKLKNGEINVKTICYEQPETAAKHLRFLDRVQQYAEYDNSKEFRKIETTVLIGPAGCGKTSTVTKSEKDLFIVNAEDNFPFDGYDGQTAILIDDFYGQLKYGHLLRILDGHQLRINVKGGHRYAKWTKIYITSNQNENEWYKFGLTEALARRINNVTKWPGNTVQATINESNYEYDF